MRSSQSGWNGVVDLGGVDGEVDGRREKGRADDEACVVGGTAVEGDGSICM